MAYADLTRERAAGIVSFLMRFGAGETISWYAGNYPAGSNPAWFTGSNLGIEVNMDLPGAPGQPPSASDFAARMRAYANLFGGIRLTRIVVYLSTDAAPEVQFDGTAIAVTVYNVGDFAAVVPLPGIADLNPITEDTIRDCTYNLINYYNAYCRGTPLTLTNTVCHTSCHTSCHSSRGRR
jgi:hypothetical protein